MSWRLEETEKGSTDIVWDGVETGVAVSPLKGTANIQNANISTDTGEVLASYGRTNQAQQAITGGMLTPDGATLLNAPANLKAGTWIKVTASTITDIVPATNPVTAAIDYLVVGGGGGGGMARSVAENTAGGGGGGGEVVEDTVGITVGTHTVTVGEGGAGSTNISNLSQPGGDTIFGAISTALGGGRGGDGDVTADLDGGDGSSGGGGGGYEPTTVAGTGGTGTPDNNGGDGNIAGSGGGGGSAVGAGTSGGAADGGAGGADTSSSLSGSSVTYGGGGGGGAGSGSAGEASSSAGDGGDNTNGSNAPANRGGGGGGASQFGSSGDKIGGDGGSGIVIISYPTGSLLATGGNVTQIDGNTIHTFTSNGVFEVVLINSGGYYFVSYENASDKIKLSTKYDPFGANAITHGTTGSATFDTVATIGPAIAKAVEKYGTATNTEYRYYVLDDNGFVWVYDSGVYDATLISNGVGTQWMLPDPTNYGELDFTGMAVLNGWLNVLNCSSVWTKPTVNLGLPFIPAVNMKLSNPFPTHRNFAYTGNQGKMFYTDGNYIGEVLPTTSLLTFLANIQSYASYTSSTTTGTISALIGGSLPYTLDSNDDVARIPAVFFTDVYGTQPTNLTEGTVYWIEVNIETGTFQVYTASTGGSPRNIETGATGNQYFNTFYPSSADAGALGANSTVQFTQQRVNLPYNEVSQCMVEVGNTVIIGGTSNILYPWNQIDATPSDFIALPEANVQTMINVNNMVYVFAGSKGNVYITNNSVASLALKVPDYCAGIAGTPLTYIEPYFTWFDAMYLRGRVYFSILDQTATKAGNCGGVWSFIPTENAYAAQDIGASLRLENQNSYGSYNGTARILIPNEEQLAISPQFWSFWQNSHSIAASTFGIDYTNTVPVTTFRIETDLLQSGTFLYKKTFEQIEYKLATPLAAGDSLQLYYRLNATDGWTSCGTVIEETTNRLSGYFKVNFEKTQWTQFAAEATTPGTTSSSFVRLVQLRLS